jgi:O-antigen chain-terminating methyltransferase
MNTIPSNKVIDSPTFYRAFEDRHRGSRDLIKQRLRQYAHFLTPLAKLYPQGQMLDLGCDRGEWLEVAAELGFTARGVDIDAGMLAACSGLGLDVRQQELSEALQTCPDESLCVISAFHVVEHIPFEVLQRIMREAMRVLVPGGLLILETPNPENLVVGTNNFFLDPTHIRPIPSLLLEFCAEFAGFARVKTLRPQENPQLHNASDTQLIDVLAGVSPDYAVIAQKHADNEVLEPFSASFQTPFGLTLGQLAERYDAAAQQQRAAAQAQASQALADLKAELTTRVHEIATQLRHERAQTKQLITLLKEEQKQRVQTRRTFEAREAQQQAALAELQQQLVSHCEKAKTREDQLRQQIEQQHQSLYAAASTPSTPHANE